MSCALSFAVFGSYCLYLKKFLIEWQNLLDVCVALSSRFAPWYKWFYLLIRPRKLCLMVSGAKLNSVRVNTNGKVLG